MRRLSGAAGFTLLEVLASLAICVLVLASVVIAVLGIHVTQNEGRHHVQSMQLVRGAIETLKGTAFSALAESNRTVPFDAGPDGVFGTPDDLEGTLSVRLRDEMDLDADGDRGEAWVDIDGDNLNDTVARPVRVTFTWTQKFLGQSRDHTVFADTAIAR